jgi:hydrogenase assembly chaperone HypC/HupF
MCVALPARVTWIGSRSGASLPGRIRIVGSEVDVDLLLVPTVAVGDHVIAHSGYAISILTEEAAAEVMTLLGVPHDL